MLTLGFNRGRLDISGDIVQISGQTVIAAVAVNISGQNVSTSVSGNVIIGKISGQTVYLSNDGINNILLPFTLIFDKRSNSQARAILHFLDARRGSESFIMTPPPPFNIT